MSRDKNIVPVKVAILGGFFGLTGIVNRYGAD